MIAATHIVTGAVIGAATQNPFSVILGGFASHYFIDMVPHWDYRINRILRHRNISQKTLPDFVKISIDIGAGAGLILLLGWNTPFFWYALLGGFFGLLPDILAGLAVLIPHPLLRWHYILHKRIHTKRKLPNPFPSFAAQVIATSLFLLLIIGG